MNLTHLNNSEQYIIQQIEHLKKVGQYRVIPNLQHHHNMVHTMTGHQHQTLLNLSSNDYLGLGMTSQLQQEFIHQYLTDLPKFGSTSSRLLTGNDEHATQLEYELQQWYQNAIQPYQQQHNPTQTDDKTALLFNSGYHANMGILPALTQLPIKTVILADKLVHASIIDGLRLSHCQFYRYRHNDQTHLQTLLKKIDDDVQRIIIVTESIFSMDGDRADLPALVALKKQDSRIELYVDEAHAVGVFGKNGLGLAEETQTLLYIDYLIGTFGKAFASMGAYILCSQLIREWLINSMRPLIFSTSLPPITHAWTRFILQKMPSFHQKRQHLHTLSNQLKLAIEQKTQCQNPSQSPIIPYILKDNTLSVAKAQSLQQAGFYVLPIRPPTVPKNTARIRLVMNANITDEQCQQLIYHL